MGSQLSSATAYVPSSLLHVQLYSPVPMRFVSAHRQLSSGSHVVGSHPLTACVGFRLFPYGSHCSPTAESNAPLPHVGGGGGLGGGGLGGELGAVSQTVAATLRTSHDVSSYIVKADVTENTSPNASIHLHAVVSIACTIA